MSIEYLKHKIKGIDGILNNKDILVILVVILTTFASFGLGRLSKIDETRAPMRIDNSATVYNSINTNVQTNEQQSYVASKNGTKYHFPWCSGAKRIKESNKIWFSSKEEAIKAGYTPAGNCKGLE